jgi:hypothetical protein
MVLPTLAGNTAKYDDCEQLKRNMFLRTKIGSEQNY